MHAITRHHDVPPNISRAINSWTLDYMKDCVVTNTISRVVCISAQRVPVLYIRVCSDSVNTSVIRIRMACCNVTSVVVEEAGDLQQVTIYQLVRIHVGIQVSLAIICLFVWAMVGWVALPFFSFLFFFKLVCYAHVFPCIHLLNYYNYTHATPSAAKFTGI